MEIFSISSRRRALGFIIDKIIVYCLSKFLFGSLLVILNILFPLTSDDQVSAAVTLFATIVYWSGFAASPLQATIGMRLMGYYVGDSASGARLTVMHALLRTLVLHGAFLLMLLVSTFHSLGDQSSFYAFFCVYGYYLIMGGFTAFSQDGIGPHDRVADAQILIAKPLAWPISTTQTIKATAVAQNSYERLSIIIIFSIIALAIFVDGIFWNRSWWVIITHCNGISDCVRH